MADPSGATPADGVRVIFVTGDRHWTDWRRMREVLTRHEPGALVVQGGCDGADFIGEMEAKKAGHQPVTLDALWEFHGRRAGPIRNRVMGKLLAILRDAGASVACYAFHNDLDASKGTKDMTTVLDKLGIAWEHIHD